MPIMSAYGRTIAFAMILPAPTSPPPRPAPGIQTRLLPLAALRPDPANPRLMPDEQMAALMRSIQEFGFVEPVVVRRADGLVIGGHQRVEAARRLGLTEVPVVEVDLTDEQCRALNVALNRIHGEWDVPKLAEILQALPQDLAALTGFDDDAIQRVLHDAEEAIRALQGEADLDDVPAPPDEADHEARGPDRPREPPAPLRRLGERGGPRPAPRRRARSTSLNTDPPYNVKVEPRSNNAIAAGLSSFTARRRTDAPPGASTSRGTPGSPSDPREDAGEGPAARRTTSSRTRTSTRRSARGSGTLARVLLPGRSFYIWGGYANVANYPPALKASGLYFCQTIIWDKQHPVLTRKDFMGAHEWAFYGWRRAPRTSSSGPRTSTDLWDVKKVNPQSMVHLTEKPVELAARAITYSSKPGENVLDLFGGSGSTLDRGRADGPARVPDGDRPGVLRRDRRALGAPHREEGGAADVILPVTTPASVAWIRTHTGLRFDLLDPRPEAIDPRDVAHALARLCRFGGHVRRFYSVAQHSLLVADLAPLGLELPALLHDASEAYLGDVVAPLEGPPARLPRDRGTARPRGRRALRPRPRGPGRPGGPVRRRPGARTGGREPLRPGRRHSSSPPRGRRGRVPRPPPGPRLAPGAAP